MQARWLVPVAGFMCLALAVTWPLPLYLSTHLSGDPGGDTGVYVWNQWVFRHELIRHAHWPMHTDHIFAATGGADLSSHNYTVFANLLAVPLIGVLGTIATFNAIYLLLVGTSGFGAFLLVRHLTGRTAEAWIAGAAFAASPFLIARGTAHFSLVAAAPLPIFLLCALRTLHSGRTRHAILSGAVAAWAGYCDVYYTIFCILMGAFLVIYHRWTIARGPSTGRNPAITMIDGLLLAGAALVAWRLWNGPFSTVIFGGVVSVRTLYTPMMALAILATLRVQLTWRFRLDRRPGSLSGRRTVRAIAIAGLTTTAVLAPVIVSLVARLMDGRFSVTPINWRSSPPGLDLLDLFLPNPNHPLFGSPGMRWILSRGPLAFPESVASLSLVALGVIGFVLWRSRRAIPRVWIAFTALFSLMSLGPFVAVAGVNTYVPGPWLLLRYVPIVELARTPARFAVLAVLGLSVLLGFALAALRERQPHGRFVLAALAALLAFELWPSPRPLYEASVPAVYSMVREAQGETLLRLLDLPGGVRDGTSSIGDFSASSQFFQTVHRKALIGGYKSRVSNRRKRETLEIPVLAALYQLSERRPVSPELAAKARATREKFMADSCVGYVVIDHRRASAELTTFALDLLDLVPVAQSDRRELFVPRTKRAESCREATR